LLFLVVAPLPVFGAEHHCRECGYADHGSVVCPGIPPIKAVVVQMPATAAGPRSVTAATAESVLRRLEAVLACRDALDRNVKLLVALEAMLVTLQQG
jgi:hypothetical protein